MHLNLSKLISMERRQKILRRSSQKQKKNPDTLWDKMGYTLVS